MVKCPHCGYEGLTPDEGIGRRGDLLEVSTPLHAGRQILRRHVEGGTTQDRKSDDVVRLRLVYCDSCTGHAVSPSSRLYQPQRGSVTESSTRDSIAGGGWPGQSGKSCPGL